MDMGNMLLTAWLVFALVLIGMISAVEIAIQMLLKRFGKRTEAAIEDLPVTGKGHFVVFRLMTDEGVVTKQSITESHYNRLQAEDTVAVTYLPAVPAVARLSDQDATQNVYLLLNMVAIGVMFIFPPLILLWLVTLGEILFAPQLITYPILRRFQLLTYPQPAPKPKNGDLFS